MIVVVEILNSFDVALLSCLASVRDPSFCIVSHLSLSCVRTGENRNGTQCKEEKASNDNEGTKYIQGWKKRREARRIQLQ